MIAGLPSPMVKIINLYTARERKRERCARSSSIPLALIASKPNTSAVRFYDRFRQEQPQSGTLGLAA
jgi:hypothetical protein